jgi:hypothetical protein
LTDWLQAALTLIVHRVLFLQRLATTPNSDHHDVPAAFAQPAIASIRSEGVSVMAQLRRRRFLQTTAAGAASLGLSGLPANAITAATASTLRIAPFRFDVTPPIGHSCCGGWIKPIEAVDDSLEAIGYVLLGAGAPIVLCAVDWTGILNSAHVAWRTALAEAAGTTPERVAVHCVHQHNAPFACLDAEALVAAEGDLPHIVDVAFFNECLERGRKAIREALPKALEVTHVGHGQGKVIEVASNRRVYVDETGRILGMRGSACTDPKLRALPEGLIDPYLKTVAFYNGDHKIVSSHYYATHPMSYYGDGRATSDFAGLARKQRQQEEPETTHIYFTGCAGNISAGKYNDGAKETRPILTKRVYEGIVASEATLQRQPVGDAEWRTKEILPPARQSLSAEQLAAAISNKENSVVGRNRPAYELAWLQRLEKKTPIVLSSLRINDITLLHLPSESFIEYQLRAQDFSKDRFVATAAYGDGGPWYIPTKEAYPNGGYEVSVAFCEPAIDDELTKGIREL